jgi:hypothetical protein
MERVLPLLLEPLAPETKRRISPARMVKTTLYPSLDLVLEISTLSENTRT